MGEVVEIRKRGLGWDDEEDEPGIRCNADDIVWQSGRVLGALSITAGHSAGHDALESYAPLILETAAQIAKAAETWRFPEQIREETR